MLIENYENINRRIYNSINNPTLHHSEIERIIRSDSASIYRPTCFCIINPETSKVLYLSKNLHDCLGLDINIFKSRGLSYLWSFINTEDLKTLTISLESLLNYVQVEIKEVNNLQLSYSWNYRLTTTNSIELNVIQHTTPFICTRKNEKRSLKYFTVVRNNQKLPIKASINAINSIDTEHNFETLFSTNCSQKSLMQSISNRERDIIKLLNQNLSSKDISKRLFISSNTVDTHRRNILKKLRLSSTGELKAIIKNGQFIF